MYLESSLGVRDASDSLLGEEDIVLYCPSQGTNFRKGRALKVDRRDALLIIEDMETEAIVKRPPSEVRIW